jgi:RNA polymerase sigma factor (sigma-70 family)
MKSTKNQSSLAPLLQRARQGDEASIQDLLATYRPRVRTWAARRTGPDGVGTEGVSDLTQEVMVRAYGNLATFDGTDRAAWDCWLRAILDQTIVDVGRRGRWKKRNARPLPLDEANELPARESRPSQRIGRRQELTRTLQQISRLPPAQGQAIWLRHRDGYSIEEIAQLLGRTKDAVSTLIWRGLSELAKMRGESALRRRVSESRLDRAVSHYLESCDRGDSRALDALLAEYPDCASELRTIVQWIHGLADLTARDRTQPS